MKGNKKYLAVFFMSVLLVACEGGEDSEEFTQCDPNLPPYPTCDDGSENSSISVTESQLSGNAFIDVLPSEKYVIISLDPDKTYSSIANDNGNKIVSQEGGAWYLSGENLVLDSAEELNTFSDLKLENNTLTVLHENRGVTVNFKQAYKPTVAQLNKEFIADNCSDCVMKFEEDFSGIGGEGERDELVSFTWDYLQDGSVFVDFGQSIGSIRYFFTEISERSLDYVALFDFSDEPRPYIRAAALIEGEPYDTVGGNQDIIKNIESTNLSESQFPWEGTAVGKLKRWAYESRLIPVKTGNVSFAEEALDEIEDKLGMIIFDRNSIASTDDIDITHGLIVSEGTAVGPGGVVDSHACGHVSRSPDATDYPSSFYNSDGVISTKLFINLSSSQCAADIDVAIHEFGHALGMGGHYHGFGLGSAIDGNFWNVLYNMYHNEIGTEKQGLSITQIEF